MGRKGENIFYRKDGRWEARYVKEQLDNGKYKYGYVYGKSYMEAKQKRNMIQLDLERMRQQKIKGHHTFHYYMDLWLESIKFLVKTSTYVHYHSIDNRIRQKGRSVRQLCGRQSPKRPARTVDIPVYLRGAYRGRALFSQRTQCIRKPFSRARIQLLRHTYGALRTRRDTSSFGHRFDSDTRKHLQDLRRRQLYRSLRVGHRRSERNGILYCYRLFLDHQSKETQIRYPRISVFVLSRRDIRLPFVQVYLTI